MYRNRFASVSLCFEKLKNIFFASIRFVSLQFFRFVLLYFLASIFLLRSLNFFQFIFFPFLFGIKFTLVLLTVYYKQGICCCK